MPAGGVVGPSPPPQCTAQLFCASILSSRPQLEEVAVQSHHNSCSPMLMRRDETDNQLMFTKWRGKGKKTSTCTVPLSESSPSGLLSERNRGLSTKESTSLSKQIYRIEEEDLSRNKYHKGRYLEGSITAEEPPNAVETINPP